MHDRKMDHIELANMAKTAAELRDRRFYYEPLLAHHDCEVDLSCQIGGKKVLAPIWISSMTGGIRAAGLINKTLARSANKYHLGMALGSMRMALDDPAVVPEFDIRALLGDELPLFGNLGIAQIDQLLQQGELDRFEMIVEQLCLDGMCIHVNPLQEWCQSEGDQFSRSPIDVLRELLSKSDIKVILKEVGQGMGPASLEALMSLPLEAIEFAAFGGTNFSQLELLRSKNEFRSPVVTIGHSADEMVGFVNELIQKLGDKCRCKKFIVSGGIDNFLDGYYLTECLDGKALYGQAGKLLEYARKGQECLDEYIEAQIEGLRVAKLYLRVRT